MNVIVSLQSQDYVSVTMDGWKKRAAEQGAPLVTVNLLLPDGGARFWKMINARGCIKDASWIVQQCKAVIDDVRTLSGSTAVIGFVMDSASANRKACQEMHNECEEHRKTLQEQTEASGDAQQSDVDQGEGVEKSALGPFLLLQCASHTLSLLIKDIISRFDWAREVYGGANVVSKVLNNNERIYDCYRSACQSQDPLAKPTAIQTYVETRFGSYHLVLRSVLKVIAPLKSMCMHEDFEALARTCAPARKLIEVVTPSTLKIFRLRAPIVEKLIDPIMEDMHRVEADQPILSSMLPMVTGLLEHAESFSKEFPAFSSERELPDALADAETSSGDDQLSLDAGMHQFFQWRLNEFYMKDSMYAAYMLHPANFLTVNNGVTYKLPREALSHEDIARFTNEVQRLGADAALEVLLVVRGEGIPFKNSLDSLNSEKFVAVMHAAGGVASIRAPMHRKNLWTSALSSTFPHLTVVAAKLLSMHVTSCASERNLSKFCRLYDKLRGRLSIETSDKMVFVAQNRHASVVEAMDEEILLACIQEHVRGDAACAEDDVELVA